MARPVSPEPKYFLDPSAAAAGYEAYHQKYFAGAEGVKWLGEKSTSYMECENAAKSIVSLIPDALIVVMLRDPVERTISNYYFTKAHGMEPYSMERALIEEPERIQTWDRSKISVSPHAYTERGKYIQHLEFWERYFGRDQLILLIAERFIANKTAVTDLYHRFGLDETLSPSTLNELVNAGDHDLSDSFIPDSLYGMLAEQFRPWNRRLAEHFKLDLSCWRGMS